MLKNFSGLGFSKMVLLHTIEFVLLKILLCNKYKSAIIKKRSLRTKIVIMITLGNRLKSKLSSNWFFNLKIPISLDWSCKSQEPHISICHSIFPILFLLAVPLHYYRLNIDLQYLQYKYSSLNLKSQFRLWMLCRSDEGRACSFF